MTPSHIRNEVLRRIRSAEQLDHALIRALGIDPDAVPEEGEEPLELLRDTLPPPLGEGSPIRGNLPFDLTLSVFGENIHYSCRLSYIMTLYDEDRGGEHAPTRQMHNMTSRYEMLDWDEHDLLNEDDGSPRRQPVPEWREIDLFPLIPSALQRELDYRILKQAIAAEKEQSRQSTP